MNKLSVKNEIDLGVAILLFIAGIIWVFNNRANSEANFFSKASA